MNYRTIFYMEALSILSVIVVLANNLIRDIFLRKHKYYEREYYERKYYDTENVKTILLFTLLMISAEISIVGIISTYGNHTTISTQEDLSIKIEEIAKELSESSQTLLDIQTELENRISTVEELKKEAEIAENMISLTEEQVTAIQSKLNQELEESSGKSLIFNILISTVFFLLGLIAQPICSRFKKKPNTPVQQDKSIKGKYSEDEIEQAIKLLATIDNNQKKDGNI